MQSFKLRNFLALFLLIITFSCQEETLTGDLIKDPFRGNLLTSELIADWSVAQVDSFILERFPDLSSFPIEKGMAIYKLTYETITALGDPTIATGAMIIPKGDDGPLPIASYQHGTVIVKDEIPSNMSYEIILGVLMAGMEGYVIAMPDYLGLGDSPGLHPYVHAKSEATATVDMLRATRIACVNESTELNGQLFLFGYSQGGHATMAVFRELETYHKDEFTVTAAAPMSGPYDISGAQTDMLLSDEPYSSPFYLPYVILAYNEIYDLFDEPSEIFLEPWATEIPPMFDGQHTGWEINNMMPDEPKLILRPDVLEAFTNDPQHPLRVSFRENDVMDWLPEAPMRMYYCTGDDQVIFQNTINAFSIFQANGASQVEIVNGEDITGSSLDHGGCVEPVMILARTWFDQFRE